MSLTTLEKRNDHIIAHAHRFPYNQFPNIRELAWSSNVRIEFERLEVQEISFDL